MCLNLGNIRRLHAQLVLQPAHCQLVRAVLGHGDSEQVLGVVLHDVTALSFASSILSIAASHVARSLILLAALLARGMSPASNASSTSRANARSVSIGCSVS